MPRVVKLGIKRPATKPLLPDPEPREQKYTIFSVDDHLMEPPETFVGRMPKKFEARAPRVIETEEGHEVWSIDNTPYFQVGFMAVAGRPMEDHRVEPSRFDEVPPYEIPRVPEMEDGRFVQRGSYSAGRVRMHLIEFAENSADFAHFSNVHGRMALPWTSIKIPGIRIEHQADWQVDADNPHFALFSDRAVLHVLGRRIDRTGASAVITFVGPGGVVIFRFNVPDVGEIVMFQTHLPVGPLEQQVDFHWMADKKIPRLLVSYVIGNWVSQWREDIEIWENKVYLDRPYLAKGDGPVHRLRRWYSQFYPDRENQNRASIENRARTSTPSVGDSWSERPAAASPRAFVEPPISAGS
jgi:hypothetical protein